MKYEIVPSNQFKKDLKLAAKRGYDMNKIKNVIEKLANGEILEAKYRDHLLTGDYGGFRECHIQSDCIKKLFLISLTIRGCDAGCINCVNSSL